MANAIPVEQVETASVPTSAASDQQPSGVSAFLTQAEIEDLAVKLAMNGTPLEVGLLHFEQVRTVRLGALEKDCQSRKAILSTWISQLNELIESSTSDLRKLLAKQEDLRETKFKIYTSIQVLHLKKATIRLEMRVQQLEAEKQFFADETKRLSEREEEAKRQIVFHKESELEYAQRLHSQLIEIWKLDEGELNRRANLLQNERATVDSLVAAVEEKISRLRDVGVTRTTAGFLVWVGYTAFAGVGSLIGYLLQQRQVDPRSADLLGNVVRGFAGFFGLSQGTVFSWIPFLKMLALVGAAAGFVIIITLLCDRLLPGLNSSWRKSRNQKEKRQRVGRSPAGWKDIVGLFTVGSDRLSLFTGRITRADYSQLVAVMPYLGLAAIILFLVSALGLTIPASSTGSTPSAGATLTSASLGAIFTLLSTSACLLYATKVIEPRWERSFQQQESGSRTWLYAKVNWEFGLLVFVGVAVVLFLTFLPFSQQTNYWSWGLVGLFMTLGSIGLAYGLIYRGIFRDYEGLVRRRQEYLVRIEEFILKPTLNDIFEASEPEELTEAAARYRKAKEYLEGLKIENELSGLFSDYHPDYHDDFSRFWFNESQKERVPFQTSDLIDRPNRRLLRLIRRLGWSRKSPEVPLSWTRVSPQGVEQLKAHEEEIDRYNTQLIEIENEINQIKEQSRAVEANAAAARRERRDYEVRLWTAESECAQKLQALNMQRQKEEVVFTSAFLTGRIFHEYLSANTSTEGAPA